MGKSKSIIYIQYTNPGGYPPLEHSSQLLASQGWKVLFLGTGCLGANELVLAEHPNIQVKTMSFCNPGLLQKIHYLFFTFWVVRVTLFNKPRWVYASDSLSCLPGLVLSLLRFKVLYHEHDSPNISDQTKQTAWVTLGSAMRRLFGRKAELVILPNQERLEEFKRETQRAKRSFCVWNCPMTDEVGIQRRPRPQQSLWVLYHGSIGPSRLPMTILDALARCESKIKLRIVGYETAGHQDYLATFSNKARSLGILDQIDIKGAVPTRRDLFKLCNECDVGLSFMPMKSIDINMRHMTGASNKSFDYLACGLALLVTDLPDWNDMYVSPGYGLACNPEDPDSLTGAFRWFLDHPQEMQAMGEKGRRRILSEWNYEKQFESVLKIVDSGL